MRKILFLSLFILSIPAYASPEKVYNAETATLKNGMQIVVIPNHRAPVVSHMVWYKVGSADEPQGDAVSGAAHFLEHMMFKGTKAVPPGDFSKIIRSIGGEDNAFTSWDYTAYFQSIAKDELPRVMALEADRMMNISLPDSHLTSEHQVIIEERRSRTDNDPQNLFSEQLRAILFTASPYGEPIIGWRDDMPRLKKSDLQNYYKTWYHPNNAILVVSGDATLATVLPMAEKFYGIIPARQVPDHIRPKTPDFPAPISLKFESKDLRQPVFIRAWRAPSYITDKNEALALDIITEVLSGGASTELYQSLVVTDKVATDISLSYEGESRGEGSIWLYAVPAPKVSLEELEKAIQKKLVSLTEKGLNPKEIDKAKTRLIDSEIYARDSVMGPAMVVGQSLSYGLSLDDVETRPQKIAAVTIEDINSAFKKYLNPDTPKYFPVTGYMIPKGGK
jgi:zinc protease